MIPRSSRLAATALTLGLLAVLALIPVKLQAQQGQPGQQTKLNQFGQPVAQNPIDYSHSDSFPNIFAPYTARFVPEPRLSNSERLKRLIHDGKLSLSVQDVIALALENNLDIDLSRYTLDYAQTDILRTKSGGTNRGINPGLFGAVTAFSAGGGASSRGGGGGAGGISGGGGAVQVSQITCCDPFAGVTVGFDQRATPLNTSIVTGVPVVGSHTTSVSTFFGKGYLTGTSFVAAVSGDRQTVTSQNQLFNPAVVTNFTVGFNQHLLNGFGYRANAKFIRIAKNQVEAADSNFRQQVMTTVSTVLNLYSDLLYYRENVRVAEHALAYAQKLLSDNKRQVEIGTLAPIEVVRAESEVAARQQDLIVAQTNYLDIPPLTQALIEAEKNRPEIRQAELNIRNQEITIQTSRNGLLPSLDVFGTYSPAGLYGDQFVNGALMSGGLGDSLHQTFHNRYPDYSFGFSLTFPIRNRAGQADMATALLQERQLRTELQRQKNNIAQDVRNAVIGVTQAKAQIQAAQKSVVLAQETLDAEQKKFQLGESTVFLVIQAQRDLVTAQGTEALARSTYAKALTTFYQATGTTLKQYNIELAEAKKGEVSKPVNIPGTPIDSTQQP